MKAFIPGIALFVLFSISLLGQQQKSEQLRPVVRKADYFRVTEPLRDMKKIMPGQRDRTWKDNIIRNEVNTRTVDGYNVKGWEDPLVQKVMGKGAKGAPIVNFEGMSNLNGVLPPDTDGDVGPNHFFQMINLSFAIFDKTGTLLDGPYDNSTLWDGFIGPWTGTNDGDPIILYDEQADRWFATQFAVNTGDGTYWELIAVSATSDPMGAYYQYAWQFPVFNDYPKFGIWPDGYYCSFNMFGTYTRGAAAVFQRDSMLIGSSNAQMQLFDLPNGSEPWNMLPSDCDGANPPAGTPNYFLYFNDYSGTDEIRIWEFDTDWVTTSNTTFTDVGTLNPSSFDSDICTASREQCIHQPGTSAQLEAMSDRLMYRLQYRNFGTHESMVLNHTVDVGGGVAGIRWYELRDNGGGWSIQQEGTYSPDNDHRWMGSIAMNKNGDIGLGYTVSSSSTYPSIRYTGRLSTDPAGQMTEPETTIIAGGGSQTHSASRWGDYSHMAIDPSDDSTFWYTTEYMQSTSSAGWQTRVASFRITPSPPTAEFSASNTSPYVGTSITITDLSASSPISWAWNITPGTHSYTSGTSATSQNPEVSFSATGTYTVTLVATNAYGSDGETKTDYITVYDNSPITLPWIEDFEPVSPTQTFIANTNPISGIPEWAYEKTANGRLRFQSGSGFYHGGTHAATMDADPSGTVSINYLTATLNLTNYTTADLLFSFWFMHHGEESSTNDRVWIRGSDSETWVEVYNLFTNQGSSGTWNEVADLDIDALLAAAAPSQTVSSTFQIRLGQQDNWPATSTTASDGYTFDDIIVEAEGSGIAPVVDFSANITAGESSINISFTDLSANIPTQWRWSFPGGNPTYSELQNPVIRYDDEGYFDVTLMASNASGSDYLSKVDYIALTAERNSFSDDFESGSPAWALSGEFERAAPAGLGGVSDGNPDPSSAYGGSSVLGTDLSGLGANSGDYEPSLSSLAYTAVSPVINCSNYSNVKLGFMRYLNVETPTYDEAFIHVNNGSGWVQVWTNTGAVSDAAWTWTEYDISTVADNESSIQVRFGLGPTSNNNHYSGWNIDSLVVKGQTLGAEHHVSWTGSANSNWNNAANWSHGTVPDANTNVYIPQFIPGGNTVNTFSSGTSEINDLYIERNAILTIPVGHSITVTGDLNIDED
jgi:PKD repeat protein